MGSEFLDESFFLHQHTVSAQKQCATERAFHLVSHFSIFISLLVFLLAQNATIFRALLCNGRIFIFIFNQKRKKNVFQATGERRERRKIISLNFCSCLNSFMAFKKTEKKTSEYQTIFFSFPHLETSFSVSSAASANNLI